MGYLERKSFYQQVEKIRGRPLISYVTSLRPGTTACISGDAISEFIRHLEDIGASGEIDVLIVSNGGDPTAALRIVSLIREKAGGFYALIPYSAFSAATLIALGANGIYMHPYGNLGPTDPQITNPQKNLQFSTEDLPALLKFARDDVKLTDQEYLLEVFRMFCNEAGSMALGFAARQSLLWNQVAQKLLNTHMESKEETSNIAKRLSREHFHHGYSISPTEAKGMGLPIEDSNAELDSLLWSIWLSLSEEMKNDEPFLPLGILKANPDCAPLFEPVPHLRIPAGTPQNVAQAVFNDFLTKNAIVAVPPVDYTLEIAIMESSRRSAALMLQGQVFARRNPDLRIDTNCIPYDAKWQSRE